MVAKVVAPPISSVPMVEPRWEIRKYLSSLVFILRDLFARSLPKNIQIGIGGAVGLLIASIGLNTSGLAAAGEDGSFINFSDKSVQLGLIGLAIALLLTYLKITVNGRTYKIKGALLISIVLTTIIGIPMGVTVLPPCQTPGRK